MLSFSSSGALNTRFDARFEYIPARHSCVFTGIGQTTQIHNAYSRVGIKMQCNYVIIYSNSWVAQKLTVDKHT